MTSTAFIPFACMRMQDEFSRPAAATPATRQAHTSPPRAPRRLAVRAPVVLIVRQ